MSAVVAEILLLGVTAFGGLVVTEQIAEWHAIHAAARFDEAVSYCQAHASDATHCAGGLPVACPQGGIYAPLNGVPGAFECAKASPLH